MAQLSLLTQAGDKLRLGRLELIFQVMVFLIEPEHELCVITLICVAQAQLVKTPAARRLGKSRRVQFDLTEESETEFLAPPINSHESQHFKHPAARVSPRQEAMEEMPNVIKDKQSRKECKRCPQPAVQGNYGFCLEHRNFLNIVPAAAYHIPPRHTAAGPQPSLAITTLPIRTPDSQDRELVMGKVRMPPQTQ